MVDDGVNAADRLWDVIVVGTGMGGGMAGRRLAEAGLSVLFIEKGVASAREYRDGDNELESPDERLAIGRVAHRVGLKIDDDDRDFYPAIGVSVGGSTTFYSGSLERLEPHDVDDDPARPHPTGGWPIRYAELKPYYDVAERWLHVLGTRDPLGEAVPDEMRRPPPMRPQDAQLMQDMAAAGLSPYRLHVGIAYKPGCAECLGVPCQRACKQDARNCGVEPAIAAGAAMMTQAEVVRIKADDARVTGVWVRQGGREERHRGRVVVLAAGTMATAPLLLESANAHWPNGLANASGLVGRNLMFHADEWVAVWPSRRMNGAGPAKSVASRALYSAGGERLGMIHSTGLSAGYGNILQFLYGWLEASPLRRVRPLKPFMRIPAKIAARLFGSATILSFIIEDMPYPDNRLELDASREGGVTVHYRFRPELTRRARLARTLLRERLGRRLFFLNKAAVLNFGHPMGTCRFGDDPATSVLDRDCRAHGIDNLYVVDGSFMPSGGGVNPSLTIAANAIRVADRIVERLRPDASAEPKLAQDLALEGERELDQPILVEDAPAGSAVGQVEDRQAP
ncbi:choline dehydrogenase-like flavoprotein [Sphingomonas jejuensis]|uniref:Choline dehydrogenase-like flavoprotein n=1 Tax=Sphingomonas jejuensis TaxID=904715 RepID=A0ABX0XMY9_9SPHN|nr:choline dehydrogenase-like flavoprotein [Sphingomonas jejuensis]